MGPKIALGAITTAFLVLTIIHLRIHQRSYRHLDPIAGIAKVMGVPTGFPELREQVNSFVDALNETHRSVNAYTAVGYLLSFLATLTSLIALFVAE